ncbi:MAG: signal transduction histidine kinase [Oceanicoccus sp.]|jgi:signal transduction histidine kinase
MTTNVRSLRWLSRIVLFLLLFNCIASLSATELPVLGLTPGKSVPEVKGFIRYQVPYSSQQLGDFLVPSQDHLQSIQSSEIQFGPPQGEVLVVLKVKNEGSENGNWIFNTDRGSLKHIQMFELRGDHIRQQFNGDDIESVKKNLRQYHSFSFELKLKAGEESIVAVVFEAENSTSMPITIRAPADFYDGIMIQSVIMSIVATGIIILVIFNSILYMFVAKRVFLYIIVAELAYLFQTFHIQGYTTIYLFYDNPGLSRSLAEGAKCVFAFCMAQFARSFLNTVTSMPNIDKALRVIIGLAVICFTLLLFRSFYSEDTLTNIHYFAWVVASLSGLCMPIVAFKAIQLKGWTHWPLLVSWGIMGLFIAHIALASASLIPSLPYQWYWTGPVGLLEAFFLTLVTGLYVRDAQRDALVTQMELTQSQNDKLRVEAVAARLTVEKATVIEGLDQQNTLMHAAGHDSKQVLLALQSIAIVLEKTPEGAIPEDVLGLLKSSSNYLKQIVTTTMASTFGFAYNHDRLAIGQGSIDDLLHAMVLIYKGEAQNKNVFLRVMAPTNQDIISDFSLLSRVLSNLVHNAIKFSSSGEVSLSASYGLDGNLHVTITDQGCGMSPETLKILLDNTVQRHRASDEVEGSGSGMNAARRIIDRLGGTIDISSKLGEGTAVVVTIPDLGHVKGNVKGNVMGNVEKPKDNTINNVILFDPDQSNGDDRQRQLDNVIDENPDRNIVFMTHDDSIGLREWMNEYASVILYKPVSPGILQHAVVQGLFSQSGNSQIKPS